MKQTFFITGTDTGCGKTFITRTLIQTFRQQNKQVVALKPIASGVDAEGYNEDARFLAADTETPIHQVNPICFQRPIAPSIAASLEARELTVNTVWDACQPTLEKPADVVLIEGVGGLLVPLNEQETGIDLIKKFKCPVILVVG